MLVLIVYTRCEWTSVCFFEISEVAEMEKKWPMTSKKPVHPRPVETYFRTAFFVDSTGRNIAIVHQTQEVWECAK